MTVIYLQKSVFLSDNGYHVDSAQSCFMKTVLFWSNRKHLVSFWAMGFPFDIVKVGKCYACKYMYKVAVILNILFVVYTLCLYVFSLFCLHIFQSIFYKRFGHTHAEAWIWRDQHVKLQNGWRNGFVLLHSPTLCQAHVVCVHHCG